MALVSTETGCLNSQVRLMRFRGRARLASIASGFRHWMCIRLRENQGTGLPAKEVWRKDDQDC